MPRITRLFIKSGLVWFLLSLAAGLLSALDPAGLPALMPLFWHMLTVGWITQIIMGVSVWMFPGRTREEGFRAQPKPWLAFLALNVGLMLRVGAEPFAAGRPDEAAAVVLGLSGPFCSFPGPGPICWRSGPGCSPRRSGDGSVERSGSAGGRKGSGNPSGRNKPAS
ncbi:MAG: hypothetical protein U5K31_06805 [Balneolaceae bacterium]|nr:hypothetical protein [Balneolaceae bacterium]